MSDTNKNESVVIARYKAHISPDGASRVVYGDGLTFAICLRVADAEEIAAALNAKDHWRDRAVAAEAALAKFNAVLGGNP